MPSLTRRMPVLGADGSGGKTATDVCRRATASCRTPPPKETSGGPAAARAAAVNGDALRGSGSAGEGKGAGPAAVSAAEEISSVMGA